MNEKNEKLQAMLTHFEREVIEAFSFLEKEYGFQRMEMEEQSLNDIRDANIFIVYKGEKIAVEIRWFFLSAAILAILIEMQDGVLPEKSSTFVIDQAYARAINLYTLLQVTDPEAVKDFTLQYKRPETFREIKKRGRIINEDLGKVLDNLAYMLRKYATPIIEGDTSIFPEVQEHEKKIRERF